MRGSMVIAIGLIVWTVNVQGYAIQGRIKLPDRNNKDLGKARVIVHGAGTSFTLVPVQDGRFRLDRAPAGGYMVECHHPDYLFESFRVEVPEEAGSRVRAKLLMSQDRIRYPLVLEPQAAAEYFEPVQGFNPLSFLKNPMVLILGFGVLASMLMPKMTAAIEAEQARSQQLQQQQQQTRHQRRSS